MTIQQSEHVDQAPERELRAAFYENIKTGGQLSVTAAVATMRWISRLTPAPFVRF